jgi:hypothetical protein
LSPLNTRAPAAQIGKVWNKKSRAGYCRWNLFTGLFTDVDNCGPFSREPLYQSEFSISRFLIGKAKEKFFK